MIRLVGFDKSQRQHLNTFFTKGTPITLEGSQIQYNQFHKKLEVAIKSHTKIVPSARKFDVSDLKTVGSKTISLSNLPNRHEFDKVTIRAHVTHVEEAR